jgi:hypothetical protein
MTSIRIWIVLLINSLVIITVVLLSIFFYQQFKEALDERVLLQLTSIRLKRVQIEEYINNEWKVFSDSVSRLKPSEMSQLNVSENTLLVDTTCLKSQLINTKIKTGIYDISDCSIDSQPKIAFVVNKDDFCHLKIINTTRIQSILLERPGMGYLMTTEVYQFTAPIIS